MKKVLIIEDDFYIRQMYHQSFNQAGYQVDVAEDGKNAADKLAKNTYSIILLDVMLPGVDGIEVLKTIRFEKSPNKKSIVFVLTNNDDSLVREQAMSSGADKYFIKANHTPGDLVKEADGLLPKTG